MLYEIQLLLFYSDLGSDSNNAALLVFRVLLCLQLLRVHGLKKLGGADGVPEVVPNPFGLPPKLNQYMVIFCDAFAPILVMFGFLTRLSVLPIMAVTLTGYFVVHRKDPAGVRDVPFMYSMCFLFILAVGAGRFSVDAYLCSGCSERGL